MMNYDKLLNPVIVAEKPSGIRRFFDLASTMQDCIVLGVGEPDFKTPWAIREAGITSLEKGITTFTADSKQEKFCNAVSNGKPTDF
ncbi:MAG: hypothetical protein J6C76_05140 [Oscillospiraceae bacterium]|nr:hypothetical protein [Oscillospiraceae bacterium]